MQIIKSYDKEQKQWIAINVVDTTNGNGDSNIYESAVNDLIDNKLIDVKSDIASIKQTDTNQDSKIQTLENKVQNLENGSTSTGGLTESQVNGLIDNKLTDVKSQLNRVDLGSANNAYNIGVMSELVTSNKDQLVKAINETFTLASNGKTLVANAITGKGVPTSNTDTFATMAENIEKIKAGSSDSIVVDSSGYNDQTTATKKGVSNFLFSSMFNQYKDNIDYSNLDHAEYLFSNLNSDIESIKLTSNNAPRLTYCNYMFEDAYLPNLTSLEIGGKILNDLSNLFYNTCTPNLKSVKIHLPKNGPSKTSWTSLYNVSSNPVYLDELVIDFDPNKGYLGYYSDLKIVINFYFNSVDVVNNLFDNLPDLNNSDVSIESGKNLTLSITQSRIKGFTNSNSLHTSVATDKGWIITY